MSFTFTNYAGIEPQASPMQDFIGKILGSYADTTKAQYLKPNLEEELKKSKLFNQYYGPNMESQMGLRSAQSGHYGALTKGQNIKNKYLPRSLENEAIASEMKAHNPLLGMTGIAGQVGALNYLREHPELFNRNQEMSEVTDHGQSLIPPINQDNQTEQFSQELDPVQLLQQSILKNLQPKQKEFAPSNIRKLQQELQDVEAGYYPGTNRTAHIESEERKEELASPYREHLGGLGKGEHYVYDPESHEKIGIQRPYSAKERETEVGRGFFNEVFPTINEGFKDFVGKGSVDNFLKYANDYGKNEVATRKVDDLLLAQKLISAGVVNEAATLGAGKTNMTYRNLAKSFPNSDIPNLIQRYGNELKLPGEAFMKAGIRFNNIINKATEKSIGSVPALKTSYFRPEKHLEVGEKKSTKIKNNEHYTDSDIRATAKKYGISEEEVKNRLKKAKKNV